jgi:DNA-binding XRE family transcriptional regulator
MCKPEQANMTRWERMEKWDADSKAFRELIREDLADLKLGSQIAAARERAKLTQTALAARAGMPGSKISTLENRIQNVEVATLIRIARAARCRLHISFER